MNSGYNGSFTDLLNDDSLVYGDSCAIDSNIDIEDTNKVQVQPRSKRSSNFSREEDICIVSSWLNNTNFSREENICIVQPMLSISFVFFFFSCSYEHFKIIRVRI
ncbi:hypothetical protein ACP275_06G125500 [Erythranthe tilingii]